MTWPGGSQRAAGTTTACTSCLALLVVSIVMATPAPSRAARAPRDQPKQNLEQLWETFPLSEARERKSPAAPERPVAPRPAVAPPAARRAETTPVPSGSRPRVVRPKAPERLVAPRAPPTTTTPAVPDRPVAPHSPRSGQTPTPPGANTKPQPGTTAIEASTPREPRQASPPPFTREPGGSGPYVAPVVGIVTALLLAVACLLAVAWRFGLVNGLASWGPERRYAEIGAQILVAAAVSAVVGWLIATRFPV
jgi:hypothetical protein